MGKLWMVLLLVASPAFAQDDLPSMTNAELCIRHDISLILGQSLDGNSEPVQAAELTRRGEACMPSDVYMQAAIQRVQAAKEVMAQREASAHDQAQADALAQEREREDRSARIRAAGRAYLQLQQQNQPTTTSCRQTLLGMDCTTR